MKKQFLLQWLSPIYGNFMQPLLAPSFASITTDEDMLSHYQSIAAPIQPLFLCLLSTKYIYSQGFENYFNHCIASLAPQTLQAMKDLQLNKCAKVLETALNAVFPQYESDTTQRKALLKNFLHGSDAKSNQALLEKLTQTFEDASNVLRSKIDAAFKKICKNDPVIAQLNYVANLTYINYSRVIQPEIKVYDHEDIYLSFYQGLPSPMREIYLIADSNYEMTDCGDESFFTGSFGICVPELIDAYKLLGMHLTADTLEKAAAFLGKPYPRDEMARREAYEQNCKTDDEESRFQDMSYAEGVTAAQASSSTFEDFAYLLDYYHEEENGGFEAIATKLAIPYLLDEAHMTQVMTQVKAAHQIAANAIDAMQRKEVIQTSYLYQALLACHLPQFKKLWHKYRKTIKPTELKKLDKYMPDTLRPMLPSQLKQLVKQIPDNLKPLFYLETVLYPVTQNYRDFDSYHIHIFANYAKDALQTMQALNLTELAQAFEDNLNTFTKPYPTDHDERLEIHDFQSEEQTEAKSKRKNEQCLQFILIARAAIPRIEAYAQEVLTQSAQDYPQLKMRQDSEPSALLLRKTQLCHAISALNSHAENTSAILSPTLDQLACLPEPVRAAYLLDTLKILLRMYSYSGAKFLTNPFVSLYGEMVTSLQYIGLAKQAQLLQSVLELANVVKDQAANSKKSVRLSKSQQVALGDLIYELTHPQAF